MIIFVMLMIFNPVRIAAGAAPAGRPASGERGSTSPHLLVAAALAGILIFGLLRLMFVPDPPQVHHHANFALMVEGERVDFSADRYMQDVAACAADPEHVVPEQRVHLHNNDPDVVHVHHAGVTWGHFFTNIGYGLGDDYLVTDRGEWYRSDGERSLKFVVNGHPVPTIRNRLIASEDRLLVSYGTEEVDEVAVAELPLVASNAGQFNTMPDPAGCSGAEEPDVGDRLKRAFWF